MATTAPAPQMGDDPPKVVWNNTPKTFHMPNGQWVLPHSSNKITGWDIWKDDDVVKNWLASGALTEDEPLPPPVPLEAKGFILTPAPNVFSGVKEPPGIRPVKREAPAAAPTAAASAVQSSSGPATTAQAPTASP